VTSGKENEGKAVPLSAKQFHYAFANTLSRDESDKLYERYHVPAASTVLFEGASANFTATRRPRWTSATTTGPRCCSSPSATTTSSSPNGACPVATGVSGVSPTRGFTERRRRDRGDRLPPGQYDTGHDWPVLTAEVTPRLSTASWTFTVDGLVERPTTWTWDEIHAFPTSRYVGDTHCVTTWPKLDMIFTGVSVDTLLEVAGPLGNATHVLARSHTGCSTNLPLADVTTTSPASGSATATTTEATPGSSSATRATEPLAGRLRAAVEGQP
jgi:hypothetical protein